MFNHLTAINYVITICLILIIAINYDLLLAYPCKICGIKLHHLPIIRYQYTLDGPHWTIIPDQKKNKNKTKQKKKKKLSHQVPFGREWKGHATIPILVCLTAPTDVNVMR